MSTTTDVCLYHLKVLLLDISPMLWRRLLVRSDSTIADLHHIEDLGKHEMVPLAWQCLPCFFGLRSAVSGRSAAGSA